MLIDTMHCIKRKDNMTSGSINSNPNINKKDFFHVSSGIPDPKQIDIVIRDEKMEAHPDETENNLFCRKKTDIWDRFVPMSNDYFDRINFGWPIEDESALAKLQKHNTTNR